MNKRDEDIRLHGLLRGPSPFRPVAKGLAVDLGLSRPELVSSTFPIGPDSKDRYLCEMVLYALLCY